MRSGLQYIRGKIQTLTPDMNADIGRFSGVCGKDQFNVSYCSGMVRVTQHNTWTQSRLS